MLRIALSAAAIDPKTWHIQLLVFVNVFTELFLRAIPLLLMGAIYIDSNSMSILFYMILFLLGVVQIFFTYHNPAHSFILCHNSSM